MTRTRSLRTVNSPTVASSPGFSRNSSSFFERVAPEAQEDQHDPEVDDVAAVAALVAADQADDRREEIRAGVPAPDVAAADELLRDGAGHEGAQREAQARRPDGRRPNHLSVAGRHDRRRHRPEERIAEVRQRRLAPGEQRTDAGQQQQDEADRHHPLVEERLRRP